MAKVLIVDDDAVLLRMYARVFGYEGLEVVSASDGLKGLEMAKTSKPDIILLDIMMPQMSGLQMLDALKGEAGTADIPVIVFTNLAGRQDLDSVLAKGAVAAVNKTNLTPKQLVGMVKEELNKRGVAVPTQGGNMTGDTGQAGASPNQAGGEPMPQTANQPVSVVDGKPVNKSQSAMDQNTSATTAEPNSTGA